MIAFCLIGFAFLFYISYRLYQHFVPTPNINPNGKYVLISGCDTGFGHGLAVELDQQGFNVLAGVFISDNVTSLKNKLSLKATVFRLDITKQEDIDAVYDLVKGKTNTLHALVNNAGIYGGGYIDWTSLELMRKIMEVNYFGHVAMTKKFLPLLIAKRGSRVINISSAAGYLTLASMSTYSGSKFALESFSDCLRREMFPWGLHVIIIEPGFMRTPIIEAVIKEFSESWTSASSDVQERWGEKFLKSQHDEAAENLLIKYAENPIKVVHAIQHAVTNTLPYIRYRPGWQSSIVLFPLSMIPAWILDWLLIKSIRSNNVPAGIFKQLQD